MADIGTGDDEAVGMNRIGRIRYQYRIARPSVASARCARPSFEPMVTMASVSGSRSTSKRRLYQLQMARRSRGMPLETE